MISMARIQRLFLEAGSIKDMGKALGISPYQYSRWESGAYFRVKLNQEQAQALASLLLCLPSDIVDKNGRAVMFPGIGHEEAVLKKNGKA